MERKQEEGRERGKQRIEFLDKAIGNKSSTVKTVRYRYSTLGRNVLTLKTSTVFSHLLRAAMGELASERCSGR